MLYMLMERVFEGIFWVIGTLWNALNAVLDFLFGLVVSLFTGGGLLGGSGLFSFTGKVLKGVGVLAEQGSSLLEALPGNGLIPVGIAFVLLIIGARMWYKQIYRFFHSDKELKMPELPWWMLFYYYLMKIFYPLLTIELTFLCYMSGNGSDVGMLDVMVDKEIHYDFFNYDLWKETPRNFAFILLMIFAVKVISCALGRKPFHLVRFLVYSVDCALIGWIIGVVFLVFTEVTNNGFPGILIYLPVSFVVYITIPFFFFAGMTLPILVVAGTICAPLIDVVTRLLRAGNCTVEWGGKTYKSNFWALLALSLRE